MGTLRNFGLLGIFVCLFSVSTVWAQTGSITGTVKDSSGGVMPGTMITITNTGTNAQRTAPTDERGDYTIALLPVGVYKIQAGCSGFKTGLADNIMLNVNDKLRIDFTLQVGGNNEQVTVTDAAPLVQSETSSVGQVLDNQKILELPLNGRQFESLSQLVPGAVSPAPGSSLSARGGFNASGGRETQNSFMLDGINNNDPATNNWAVRPIVDAIQEFKVVENSYSAEFGRSGASQVTVTTKSGTNSFHGAAWEFLRNDVLDARDFFNTTGPKAPFLRNQYGATFGGPIRHDKTFFFVAYEGLNRKQSFTSLQQVPSLAFLQGDFSSVKTALKNPFGAGGATFTGNQISPTLFNPVSQKVIAMGAWPQPTPGLTGASNLQATLAQVENVSSINGRIDHRLSNANTLFARYSLTHDLLHQPCPSAAQVPTCVPGYGMLDTTNSQALSLTDTHVFSSKLLNEVRAGFNRFLEPRVALTAATNNIGGTLGLPTNPFPMAWGMPTFSISSTGTIGDMPWSPRVGNTYQISEGVSFSKGSHWMRAGFEWRKQEFNATQATREGFTFDGRWTGNAFADFELGLPASTSRDLLAADIRYHRIYSYAGYFQDDWKASNRLTVNLGLRYEFNTPDVEKYNRYADFNIQTGQYQTAGLNGASRALYDPDRNNWGPRVGFAFRPGDSSKSVFRGGYGIFYDLVMLGNDLDPTRKGYPFDKPETYSSTPGNPNALTLSNPFPASQSSTTIYNAPGVDPRFRDAYIQQWNFGYQLEFAKNMVFEAGYIGTKGTRLTRAIDLNQAFPGTTGSVQSRRPFPQYGTMSMLTSIGDSTYNALVGGLERRFSGGLSLLASYTYSHSIDSGAGGGGVTQDARNTQPDRGNSDFDARQRLVISYVYDLPVGHDRHFGKSLPPVLNYVVGGWQLSGITAFQSGRPIFIKLGKDNGSTGVNNDRPNIVAGVDPLLENSGSKTVYLNPAAFVSAPAGTFGNDPRNNINGPGTNNFDLTLAKNFKTEKFGIQFRAELFNAFNHPFLNQPVSTLTNPAFGTITSTLGPNRQVQFGLKISY